MTITSLPKIKTMVERYKLLKLEKDELDKVYDESTKYIKSEMATLKDALIDSLHATGVPSIRTDDGYRVTYKKETEIVVTNDLFAYKWALKNSAVRIDKDIAKQIIKELKEVPEGFSKVDKETIALTKSKGKEK